MKNLILAIILLISTSLSAQVSSQSETSEQIKKVIQTLVDAWSEGDAESFASNFTENADFTVWFGMQLNGQKEIAFGHSIIFKEFYANTKWDLNINKIRFIGEDYALVHCSGSVLKKGTKNSDEPDAVPLLIFQRINENWKIMTLQNTPYAVTEFRENGDIRRMKRIIREYKE